MSAREASLVPTNLQEWPICDGLEVLPRLVLSVLWSNRYVGCEGAGQISIPALAATIGVEPGPFKEAIYELERRNLIIWEEATSEVFILAWFRFHHFKSVVAKGILAGAIKKIVSARIREVILEKSKGCLPAASASPSASAAGGGEEKEKNARKKYYFSPELGDIELECGNSRDLETATQLIKKWGLEAINFAVLHIKEDGRRGFPSNISAYMAASLNSKFSPREESAGRDWEETKASFQKNLSKIRAAVQLGEGK